MNNIDKEPPTLRCFDGTVTANADPARKLSHRPIIWPFEEISDNSGQIVALTCIPRRGSHFYSFGTTKYTCTAYDDAGNNASCSSTVFVKGKKKSTFFLTKETLDHDVTCGLHPIISIYSVMDTYVHYEC